MPKKVLTTALLGVSALGVSTANAAANGLYVSGQLGYSNTHMKDKTIPSLNSRDIGGQAEKLNFSKTIENDDFAGRLALGYQFNQNFAVELGYLQIDKKKSRFSGKFTDDGELLPHNFYGSLKLRQYAIDLVGKGIIPLSDKLNVYGKLGGLFNH